MLPAASSVTPGISLLPRTRGPIPERNRRLPTRLACGNAPTGSGARELSNVSAMFEHNCRAAAPAAKSKSASGALALQQLATGDRAHDEERLCAVCDRVGQGRIRWIMRHIFAADKEPHQRSALLRVVIANRPAQHRILCFERIEKRLDCDGSVKIDNYLVTDTGERAQMVRKNNADHEIKSQYSKPKLQTNSKIPRLENSKQGQSRKILGLVIGTCLGFGACDLGFLLRQCLRFDRENGWKIAHDRKP